MAQLRDAQTSEILAEGSPLEVALIAQTLGRREVLFDDVGQGFDPDAVIAAHEEHLAALNSVAANDELDEDDRARASEAAAAEAALEAAAEAAAPEAQDRLEEARARVKD